VLPICITLATLIPITLTLSFVLLLLLLLFRQVPIALTFIEGGDGLGPQGGEKRGSYGREIPEFVAILIGLAHTFDSPLPTMKGGVGSKISIPT
jgi:hypothetical protein